MRCACSLNKVILDMIYQCTGQKENVKDPGEESLRNFAGGWSREQGEEFLESIKSCERIDEGAQTMEHGAELLTSDRHFEKVPGLVYTRF
jgi:hypothetical protein